MVRLAPPEGLGGLGLQVGLGPKALGPEEAGEVQGGLLRQVPGEEEEPPPPSRLAHSAPRAQRASWESPKASSYRSATLRRAKLGVPTSKPKSSRKRWTRGERGLAVALATARTPRAFLLSPSAIRSASSGFFLRSRMRERPFSRSSGVKPRSSRTRSTFRADLRRLSTSSTKRKSTGRGSRAWFL